MNDHAVVIAEIFFHHELNVGGRNGLKFLQIGVYSQRVAVIGDSAFNGDRLTVIVLAVSEHLRD